MNDLRKHPRFDETPGICDAVWQGDFGRGISTGSGTFSEAGVSPYQLYGPLSATANTVMVGSIPALPFRVGSVVNGDMNTEWVFCRWVAGATTDLTPGLVFQVDENFTATLITTANGSKNTSAGVSVVFQPAVVAGTYYLWLCIAGHVAVQAAAASLAGGQAESTATAGVVKFLNTHTAASWSILPLTAYAASSNITFTGDTLINQPYITNVASQISVNGVVGGITDLMLGQVMTGTGMPANALIRTIESYQGKWRIGIGTNTAGNQNVAQNATATNATVTFTVTNMVQGLAYWPVVANAVT